MRTLVTGGAGFIGSHIVDLLMKLGHEVTVLDDFSSGRRENLSRHLGDPRFRLVRGDVRDPAAVRSCVEGADWVIHEAAMVSVQRSMEDPELTMDVNVAGTRTVLEECAAAGVRRFVFASSCAVYGSPEKIPVGEDARPDPLSPYARSKLEAEGICMEFHRDEGVPVVCLRYFNVYGPRQAGGDYAGVIVRFIERLRSGLPPQIYGDGNQTRDFVHVSDVARATVLALEREEAVGSVINVGTGRETSVNELCEMLMRISGTLLRPERLPPRPGEVRRSCADISRARRILGFEPRVGIEDGVRELWEEWGRTSG
jgi:nucleoside-diphosphate-sugar epimerase